MLKDIQFKKVTDVAIAIVPRRNTMHQDDLWDVFLLNLKNTPIKSVIVNAKGYNITASDKRETTNLKYFYEQLQGKSAIIIEPIQVQLFDFTNQYWISFLHNDFLYDKKYIFVKGSINPMNFTTIPIINKKGVMIRS